MGDGQKAPEELPKKLKEDRICPGASHCKDPNHDGLSCGHGRPHITMNGCDETCFYAIGSCIQIPDVWMDKGGE